MAQAVVDLDLQDYILKHKNILRTIIDEATKNIQKAEIELSKFQKEVNEVIITLLTDHSKFSTRLRTESDGHIQYIKDKCKTDKKTTKHAIEKNEKVINLGKKKVRELEECNDYEKLLQLESEIAEIEIKPVPVLPVIQYTANVLTYNDIEKMLAKCIMRYSYIYI